MGFQVEAYEPDPDHHKKLINNLGLNNINTCTAAYEAAVSDKDGVMQFVRVLGNTTSSHLAGAKANPYGELEHFDVSGERECRAIAERVDLFKIDAEGHEAVILKGLPIRSLEAGGRFCRNWHPRKCPTWYTITLLVRALIFFRRNVAGLGQNLVDDVPFSYKEGGVFISAKKVMPW